MIATRAKINNLDVNFITAVVSSSKINLKCKVKTAYIGKTNCFTFGHSIYLSNSSSLVQNIGNKPLVYDIKDTFFDSLKDGDIVEIYSNGIVHVLWDKILNHDDLTLFVTNQCNANCIMCPQPPRKDEHSFFEINKAILSYLAKKNIKCIAITGGEPTLKSEELCSLLKHAQKIFPFARIDLLTNGRKLKEFSYAKQLALLNHNITFCVSFPSDNMEDFNKIMGVQSFTDTISAIQNLGLLRQMVELRVVIMKQNCDRLPQIAEFIYRNFPFVVHVTFMGLEIIGNAYDNFAEIDISQKEFNKNLLDAIIYLKQRDMNVSIYNMPFCLIDKRLWGFVKNSISKWKQSYLEECRLCIKAENCQGVFSTTKISKYKIQAIVDDTRKHKIL
ncbi:MAG: His-Xaa-Ser system radical SAM maturase HxsC [Campylobacteraceae bacterium]|jgi:His-Xaa-Ser system radical SAM maturase HxsC|nr:His-Xaa-Ser system radical SAM maturase HxsC [Campylobacteraceae bacterium]